jgi:hypothetical protein
MRYCVRGPRVQTDEGYGILRICNTFGGALDVVQKHRKGEQIRHHGNFRYALEELFFRVLGRMSIKRVLWIWRNTFGRYDHRGFRDIRTITIGEDVLAFSWAISRKEAEKLYRMGV